MPTSPTVVIKEHLNELLCNNLVKKKPGSNRTYVVQVSTTTAINLRAKLPKRSKRYNNINSTLYSSRSSMKKAKEKAMKPVRPSLSVRGMKSRTNENNIKSNSSTAAAACSSFPQELVNKTNNDTAVSEKNRLTNKQKNIVKKISSYCKPYNTSKINSHEDSKQVVEENKRNKESSFNNLSKTLSRHHSKDSHPRKEAKTSSHSRIKSTDRSDKTDYNKNIKNTASKYNQNGITTNTVISGGVRVPELHTNIDRIAKNVSFNLNTAQNSKAPLPVKKHISFEETILEINEHEINSVSKLKEKHSKNNLTSKSLLSSNKNSNKNNSSNISETVKVTQSVTVTKKTQSDIVKQVVALQKSDIDRSSSIDLKKHEDKSKSHYKKTFNNETNKCIIEPSKIHRNINHTETNRYNSEKSTTRANSKDRNPPAIQPGKIRDRRHTLHYSDSSSTKKDNSDKLPGKQRKRSISQERRRNSAEDVKRNVDSHHVSKCDTPSRKFKRIIIHGDESSSAESSDSDKTSSRKHVSKEATRSSYYSSDNANNSKFEENSSEIKKKKSPKKSSHKRHRSSSRHKKEHKREHKKVHVDDPKDIISISNSVSNNDKLDITSEETLVFPTNTAQNSDSGKQNSDEQSAFSGVLAKLKCLHETDTNTEIAPRIGGNNDSSEEITSNTTTPLQKTKYEELHSVRSYNPTKDDKLLYVKMCERNISPGDTGKTPGVHFTVRKLLTNSNKINFLYVIKGNQSVPCGVLCYLINHKYKIVPTVIEGSLLVDSIIKQVEILNCSLLANGIFVPLECGNFKYIYIKFETSNNVMVIIKDVIIEILQDSNLSNNVLIPEGPNIPHIVRTAQTTALPSRDLGIICYEDGALPRPPKGDTLLHNGRPPNRFLISSDELKEILESSEICNEYNMDETEEKDTIESSENENINEEVSNYNHEYWRRINEIENNRDEIPLIGQASNIFLNPEKTPLTVGEILRRFKFGTEKKCCTVTPIEDVAQKLTQVNHDAVLTVNDPEYNEFIDIEEGEGVLAVVNDGLLHEKKNTIIDLTLQEDSVEPVVISNEPNPENSKFIENLDAEGKKNILGVVSEIDLSIKQDIPAHSNGINIIYGSELLENKESIGNSGIEDILPFANETEVSINKDTTHLLAKDKLTCLDTINNIEILTNSESVTNAGVKDILNIINEPELSVKREISTQAFILNSAINKMDVVKESQAAIKREAVNKTGTEISAKCVNTVNNLEFQKNESIPNSDIEEVYVVDEIEIFLKEEITESPYAKNAKDLDMVSNPELLENDGCNRKSEMEDRNDVSSDIDKELLKKSCIIEVNADYNDVILALENARKYLVKTEVNNILSNIKDIEVVSPTLNKIDVIENNKSIVHPIIVKVESLANRIAENTLNNCPITSRKVLPILPITENMQNTSNLSNERDFTVFLTRTPFSANVTTRINPAIAASNRKVAMENNPFCEINRSIITHNVVNVKNVVPNLHREKLKKCPIVSINNNEDILPIVNKSSINIIKDISRIFKVSNRCTKSNVIINRNNINFSDEDQNRSVDSDCILKEVVKSISLDEPIYISDDDSKESAQNTTIVIQEGCTDKVIPLMEKKYKMNYFPSKRIQILRSEVSTYPKSDLETKVKVDHNEVNVEERQVEDISRDGNNLTHNVTFDNGIVQKNNLNSTNSSELGELSVENAKECNKYIENMDSHNCARQNPNENLVIGKRTSEQTTTAENIASGASSEEIEDAENPDTDPENFMKSQVVVSENKTNKAVDSSQISVDSVNESNNSIVDLYKFPQEGHSRNLVVAEKLFEKIAKSTNITSLIDRIDSEEKVSKDSTNTSINDSFKSANTVIEFNETQENVNSNNCAHQDLLEDSLLDEGRSEQIESTDSIFSSTNCGNIQNEPSEDTTKNKNTFNVKQFSVNNKSTEKVNSQNSSIQDSSSEHTSHIENKFSNSFNSQQSILQSQNKNVDQQDILMQKSGNIENSLNNEIRIGNIQESEFDLLNDTNAHINKPNDSEQNPGNCESNDTEESRGENIEQINFDPNAKNSDNDETNSIKMNGSLTTSNPRVDQSSNKLHSNLFLSNSDCFDKMHQKEKGSHLFPNEKKLRVPQIFIYENEMYAENYQKQMQKKLEHQAYILSQTSKQNPMAKVIFSTPNNDDSDNNENHNPPLKLTIRKTDTRSTRTGNYSTYESASPNIDNNNIIINFNEQEYTNNNSNNNSNNKVDDVDGNELSENIPLDEAINFITDQSTPTAPTTPSEVAQKQDDYIHVYASSMETNSQEDSIIKSTPKTQKIRMRRKSRLHEKPMYEVVNDFEEDITTASSSTLLLDQVDRQDQSQNSEIDNAKVHNDSLPSDNASSNGDNPNITSEIEPQRTMVSPEPLAAYERPLTRSSIKNKRKSCCKDQNIEQEPPIKKQKTNPTIQITKIVAMPKRRQSRAQFRHDNIIIEKVEKRKVILKDDILKKVRSTVEEKPAESEPLPSTSASLTITNSPSESKKRKRENDNPPSPEEQRVTRDAQDPALEHISQALPNTNWLELKYQIDLKGIVININKHDIPGLSSLKKNNQKSAKTIKVKSVKKSSKKSTVNESPAVAVDASDRGDHPSLPIIDSLTTPAESNDNDEMAVEQMQSAPGLDTALSRYLKPSHRHKRPNSTNLEDSSRSSKIHVRTNSTFRGQDTPSPSSQNVITINPMYEERTINLQTPPPVTVIRTTASPDCYIPATINPTTIASNNLNSQISSRVTASPFCSVIVHPMTSNNNMESSQRSKSSQILRNALDKPWEKTSWNIPKLTAKDLVSDGAVDLSKTASNTEFTFAVPARRKVANPAPQKISLTSPQHLIEIRRRSTATPFVLSEEPSSSFVSDNIIFGSGSSDHYSESTAPSNEIILHDTSSESSFGVTEIETDTAKNHFEDDSEEANQASVISSIRENRPFEIFPSENNAFKKEQLLQRQNNNFGSIFARGNDALRTPSITENIQLPSEFGTTNRHSFRTENNSYDTDPEHNSQLSIPTSDDAPPSRTGAPQGKLFRPYAQDLEDTSINFYPSVPNAAITTNQRPTYPFMSNTETISKSNMLQRPVVRDIIPPAMENIAGNNETYNTPHQMHARMAPLQKSLQLSPHLLISPPDDRNTNAFTSKNNMQSLERNISANYGSIHPSLSTVPAPAPAPAPAPTLNNARSIRTYRHRKAATEAPVANQNQHIRAMKLLSKNQQRDFKRSIPNDSNTELGGSLSTQGNHREVPPLLPQLNQTLQQSSQLRITGNKNSPIRNETIIPHRSPYIRVNQSVINPQLNEVSSTSQRNRNNQDAWNSTRPLWHVLSERENAERGNISDHLRRDNSGYREVQHQDRFRLQELRREGYESRSRDHQRYLQQQNDERRTQQNHRRPIDVLDNSRIPLRPEHIDTSVIHIGYSNSNQHKNGLNNAWVNINRNEGNKNTNNNLQQHLPSAPSSVLNTHLGSHLAAGNQNDYTFERPITATINPNFIQNVRNERNIHNGQLIQPRTTIPFASSSFMLPPNYPPPPPLHSVRNRRPSTSILASRPMPKCITCGKDTTTMCPCGNAHLCSFACKIQSAHTSCH